MRWLLVFVLFAFPASAEDYFKPYEVPSFDTPSSPVGSVYPPVIVTDGDEEAILTPNGVGGYVSTDGEILVETPRSMGMPTRKFRGPKYRARRY